MPIFSEKSKQRLDTCHPDLQKLFNEVIKHIDCSILCGNRGKEDQNKAFIDGKSKLKWPQSKHNSSPSNAIDVVPFPIDWDDKNRFYFFAGFVLATAKNLNIRVRWGGDWNSDYNFKNENFLDFPHFELEK